MFRYTREQLIDLKETVDKLRIAEERNVAPLTDVLLEQLVNRVKKSIKYDIRDIDQIIFDKPNFNLCRCLGPRNGELFCNCKMNMLRYEYRYDIALNILEE